MTPGEIEAETEEFFSAGADGYLIWQYSGFSPATGNYFENDPYSFFRDSDPEVCQALSVAGATYNNSTEIGVGVNIYGLGRNDKDQAVIRDHLSFLKNECGVKTIRVFAYAGSAPGLQKVVGVAREVGVQVIAAVGDYSNGGGGMPQGAPASWYQSPSAEYGNLLQQVASIQDPALYAIELANEPHCGDDPSAVSAYNAWAREYSNRIAAANSSVEISLGQMGHTPYCDRPGVNYAESNSQGAISICSAHYYGGEEKAFALEALAACPDGKPFYIGEAGWGGEAGNAQEDPYFLRSINGVSPGSPAYEASEDDRTQAIKTDLVKQGYEAMCSTPKLDIEAVFGGDDEAFRAVFGDTNEVIQRSVTSEQIVDLSNAQIPNLRGSEGTIFDSLEQYFAHYSREQQDSRLASGPFFFATSLKQQCTHKKQILRAAYNLCNELENPEACALDKKLPGVPFTWNSLYFETNNDNYCEDVEQRTKGLEEEDYPEDIKALIRTPLYMQDAYRLGFLVVSAELTDARFNNKFNFLREKTLTDENCGQFNFLGQTGNGSCYLPPHAVRIFAFRLPDTNMNRGLHEEYKDTHYYDAPQITRNIILSDDQRQQQVNSFIKRRDTYLEKTLAGQLAEPAQPPLINCDGQPSCETPLAKALVDMINAGITGDKYNALCGGNKELFSEDSGDITDPGGIGTFSEEQEYLWQTRQRLNEDGIFMKNNSENDGSQPGSAFSFLNVFDLNPNNAGNDKAQINAYLVTPQGEELHSVEQSLAGMFMTSNQIDIMNERVRDVSAQNIAEEQRISRFWELAGIKYTHSTPKSEYQFNAPPPYCGAYIDESSDQSTPINAITEGDAGTTSEGGDSVIPGECRTSAELTIIDQSKDPNQEESLNPRILGGVWGWVTRKAQQSLYPRGTIGWEYYESCKTTQDFLLGRCGDENVSSPEGDVGVANGEVACLGAENSVYTPEGATEQERLDNVKDLVRQVARETDTPPDLLWGVLNIEGSPFLRRVRAGQPFECAELVNSCGAVGPMQIIHGGCYQANGGTCSSGLPPSAFEALDRSPEAIGSNICNIKEALTFAAEDYLSNSGRFASYTPEQRAGLYHGYGGASADGSQNCGGEVQGCNGLNYCECATQGFSL